MNKRQPGKELLGIYAGLFRTKWVRLVFLCGTLVFAGVYLKLGLIDDYLLLPNQNELYVGSYTDSANGGNSEFTRQIINDTIIDLDFLLKEGFIGPYVGVTFLPKDSKNINLSHYNRFSVNIQCKRVKTIGLYLYTLNHFDDEKFGDLEVCFYGTIEMMPDQSYYKISLDELKVPDWWYGVNNVAPGQVIKPDLSRVKRINIGTAFTSFADPQKNITIRSMSFHRDNRNLLIWLIIAELCLIISLILFTYLKGLNKGKNSPVTVAYQPLSVNNENTQDEVFIRYITSQFQDSELTLEKVALQTGISQRRIASYITEHYQCNFKTYINQIRITESKRLMHETGLNMGEIAFKVGFNNQSHFNRVFKTITGVSPTDFRERNS